MWLRSRGKVVVDEKEGRMVIDLSFDFAKYYNWFVERQYKITPFVGKFKPHISLALPKFHKDVDWKKARKYHGRMIDFSYCIDMQEGGKNSGGRFISFWFFVRSGQIDKISKDLGLTHNKLLHITLGNTKAATIPWNGPSISIK